jgi:proteasome accessory factor B
VKDGFEKQDRVMRLMREAALFQAAPQGLTTRQVAERMAISQRQAQRDIHALETELGVPFVLNENRWSVIKGYWLPPVNFSLHEAMGLLLSARLMLRHSDRANQFVSLAYEKLAAVLPEPMRAPMLEIARGMVSKTGDGTYTRVMAALATAWAERRKVRLAYRGKDSRPRTVRPLFLEPSPIGHGCYLLAWDESRRGYRSYKVERIADVQLTSETFDPPLGFSIERHLAGAWAIWSSGEVVQVELLFSSDVAERVQETVWHPSQELEEVPDGRLRLRLQLSSTVEIRHWILGWGADCEVVKPTSLREEIEAEVGAMSRVYSRRAVSSPSKGEGRVEVSA